MHQATALLAPASICDDSLLVFGARGFSRALFPALCKKILWSGRTGKTAGKCGKKSAGLTGSEAIAGCRTLATCTRAGQHSEVNERLVK